MDDGRWNHSNSYWCQFFWEPNDVGALTELIGYGRPESNDIPKFVKSTVAEIISGDRNISLPDFVEGDICTGIPNAIIR